MSALRGGRSKADSPQSASHCCFAPIKAIRGIGSTPSKRSWFGMIASRARAEMIRFKNSFCLSDRAKAIDLG
jgi:hypothetical protein